MYDIAQMKQMSDCLLCKYGFKTDENYIAQTISMGSPLLTNKTQYDFDDDYAFVYQSTAISLAPYSKVLSAKFIPTPITLSWKNSSMNISTYYIRAIYRVWGLYSYTLGGSINGAQCPVYSITLPEENSEISQVVSSQTFYIQAEICIARVYNDSYKQQNCSGVFIPSSFNIRCEIAFA